MSIRYIRDLGQGSFGRVYLATDDQFGVVAVKELKDPTIGRDRFEREARILAEQRGNDYVVRVLRVNLTAQRPYMVLEYCEGGSLRGWVAKMTWQNVAHALLCAANGLLGIHAAGGFHRDIKPENLLITTAPDGGHIVKVADFGLAQRPATSMPPMTHSAGGTHGYMAPELHHPNGQYSAAADVYSLGITGIELLTGDLSVSSLQRSSAPQSLCRLLVRMAHPTPWFRPSMADVAIKLGELVNAPTKQPSSGLKDLLIGAGVVAGLVAAVAALARGSDKEWDESVQRYRGSDGRFRRG